jgi:hypothetical protein
MNIDNKYIVDGITNEKFEIQLEYQKTMNIFSDWWKQNINRVTPKSISYTNFT